MGSSFLQENNKSDDTMKTKAKIDQLAFFMILILCNILMKQKIIVKYT